MSNYIDYNQECKKITEQDKIIAYWKRLFPEKNRDFEELLQKISGKTLDYFLENYNNEDISDEIEEVFSDITNNCYIEKLDDILLEQTKKNMWSFFYKPVLLLYIDKLMALVEASDILEERDYFLQNVIDNIINKLSVVTYRTIIVETNIAKLDKRLLGDTSEERGKYYTHNLLKDMSYLKEVYLEYPELYKVMKRTVSYITNYFEEIISNTKANIGSLEKAFNEGKSLGKIQSVILGNGDTHNNGKTVATVMFKNKTLMYKPRSFTMENAYEEFINWVNNWVPGFSPLKTCNTYSIKDAGWMDFVEHIECDSMEDVNEFYFKMGELLCLFYTLNSKDCHCENIIANGKYPILIDLETVLHTDEFDKNEQFDSIEEYIGNYIQNSVNSVLILPSLLQNFNTNGVMEIGAIGSAKPKKSPFKTQKITNFDSDNITVEEEYKEISDAGNYPLYKGEKIGGNGYIGSVKQGFINTYAWILNNKQEYMAKIKELFSSVECRVIYKATNDYNQLISTSYHPDLLHNRMDRIVYFHRIGILIQDIKNFDQQKLYQTEIEAMLNGDVPSFKIYANSKAATNYKDEVVSDKYKKSIIETLEDKINKLSEMDLKKQVALIYLSYIGCKMETDLPRGTNTLFSNGNGLEKEHNYLEEAHQIGEKIIERGFSIEVDGKKENSWICYVGFGDDYYSINPVGWDLYKGNCGMALFFKNLGKSSKEEKYIQYAKDTLNSVDRMINLNNVRDIETIGYGVYTGIYSYVYTLYKFIQSNVYSETEEKAAWKRLYEIIDFTNQNIVAHERIDVLAGISGVMGILSTLYNSIDKNYQEVVKEILNKIVQKLKKEAITISQEEISWTDDGDIGYAHGNAGIMCHLARCYEILRDPEILDLVRKSLNYERNTRFNQDQNMWLIREKAHYYSWCNGIGGLLLTKIMLYQTSAKDEKLIQEISLLIEQLKKYGFGTDFSICHGDIGSICILKYAAEFMNDMQLMQQCTYTLNIFINNYLKSQAESIYIIEDWGIMSGKSGIGLGLLDEYRKDNTIAELLCLN